MIALTIAGSDSGGGAGIQADLKTFAALGVHGASVVTSLTAQNTRAVMAVQNVPLDFIREQFKAIREDFKIGAAKTGMLSLKEIVSLVAREVGDYPLVVDPVMVAASGGRLLNEDAVEALKRELLPKATVVTPNLFEAEVLAGIKIKSVTDMRKAAKKISKYGCSALVKGGHLNATDVLYHDKKFCEFKARKIGGSVHGSGCTFAAAIAAELAKGRRLIDAVGDAKKFITKAIETSYSPGRGAKVANQWGEILISAEKFRVTSELNEVLKEIEENQKVYKLVPEVQMNLAYALPRAKSTEEVAAVRGRIIRIGTKVRASSCAEFGASKHVASVILAAIKFDPTVRAATNIKYSQNTLNKYKKLGFKIGTFDRKYEPPGVSTMEWGTAQAIKKRGFIPDVIYDAGAESKEAMIRVLGRNPREVWEKVKRILV